MKDWEWLGVGAAVLAIGLVINNNAGRIKGAISTVHDDIISNIIPISTQASQPETAPRRRVCPPGKFLDTTLGVYTCRDPHGTHELAPANITNQWQNAWAADSPNMTQPIVPPDINAEIESQVKKQKKHKKGDRKLAEIPKSKGKVSTQIECPKNLHDLPVHSSCWKDGKLYEIVASEAERESLYPPAGKHKKKPTTIQVPPGSTVTVQPNEQEPYPEEVGDRPTDPTSIPSLQLSPGQQQIKPSVPVTSPTPIAPPQTVITGPVFYPFSPAHDKKGFAKGGGGLDTSYNKDGCRNVHYNSGPNGWTCRWQANDQVMKSHIGENGYKIEASLHIGQPKPGMTHDKEISITSGGR